MDTLALPWWAPIIAFGGICGAALWKGGRPERIAAAVMLLSWAATFALRDRRWTEPQWGGLVTDTACFIFLAVLALRSNRYWPLWAAGFQLLAVITHGARLMDPSLGAWAYVTAGVIWSYLVLFALAWGTWGYWRAGRPAESHT